MLERKPKTTSSSSEDRLTAESRQLRRLLLALGILVFGIVALLFSDRQFWFGSNPLILDGDGTEAAVAVQKNETPKPVRVAPKTPAAPQKHAVLTAAAQPASQKSTVVSRSVLPPLNVEVAAGSSHDVIQPGKASKLQIVQSAPTATVTDAAGREPIMAEAQASYPPLAQHMNVQGSVVLKAMIGADGIIQDLRVLSGPAILAAAAQQAVREWKFKPILQDGQPVETMAKIVVNFSIKVADNSEKTTLAESRAADKLLILTR